MRHDSGSAARAVTAKAVFDDPAARDHRIIEGVRTLIRGTPAGASIQAAIFVISGESGATFARELIAAHERGVRVRLILDGWKARDPAARMAAEALGRDRSAASWVHACTGLSPEGTTAACIGSKGMHNKFFLFSETGGDREVVVQSSANFTDLSAATHWNNALTIAGSEDLYAGHDAYFADLAAERRNDDYYRIVEAGTMQGAIRAYFFPRAGSDATTDTIVELLSAVTPDAVIRVGMSEWDADRIAIAERLRHLADHGCTVRVVHGPIAEVVRERLVGARGVELRALDDADHLPGRIHSKYMLIEGTYSGVRDRKLVITGSHNYNYNSLRRNDEALLLIDLPSVHEQYRSNFLRMWDVAGARSHTPAGEEPGAILP